MGTWVQSFPGETSPQGKKESKCSVPGMEQTRALKTEGHELRTCSETTEVLKGKRRPNPWVLGWSRRKAFSHTVDLIQCRVKLYSLCTYTRTKEQILSKSIVDLCCTARKYQEIVIRWKAFHKEKVKACLLKGSVTLCNEDNWVTHYLYHDNVFLETDSKAMGTNDVTLLKILSVNFLWLKAI